MFPRLIAVGFLAVLSLPAATVIVRSGAPTGDIGPGAGGLQSIYGSWTQSAGNTYSSVTISANLCSTSGTASGTWYLSNAIGSGATTANQVATGTVTGVTAACPAGTTVTLTSTPIASLPAGTYYLVFSNMTNLAWSLVSGGATEALGTGVTSNSDAASTNAPPSYPPSSTGFAALSFGPSSKVLVFSVTGTSGAAPPPSGGGTPIPTLSTWAMAGTIVLLLGSGLFLIGKFRSQE